MFFLKHHLGLRPPFEPFLTILRLGASNLCLAAAWACCRLSDAGSMGFLHPIEGVMVSVLDLDPVLLPA
jgi:hypothetical protein